MRRSASVRALRGLAALALVAGCGTACDGQASASGPAHPEHVVVVVFENHGPDQVLGSPDAPYLTGLAASGATLTDAHGITHPSQPNYLALFSGSTHGVTDDHCLDELSGGDLGSQLIDAGFTFTGWSEGLPEPGWTGCRQGEYVRRHNPWVDFPALPPEVDQPLAAMPTDFGRLPTVSFVVPGLCSDMHDCGVDAGDAWARQVLDPYVQWARQHDSLLVVTFDEDDVTDANHIPTFVVGAGVPQTTVARRVDHYDLLRTLEDWFGLPPLGEAAHASAVTEVWQAPGG